VIAVDSPTSVAETLEARGYVGLRLLSSHGTLATFSYSKTIGKRKPRRLLSEFVVAQWKDTQVYFVACCSSPAFVREALGPLLERTYSKSSAPSCRSPKLRSWCGPFRNASNLTYCG